jgi:hypothetical protein
MSIRVLVAVLCAVCGPALAEPVAVPLAPDLPATLRAAPPEFSGPGVRIDLPLPDGGWAAFEAWDSPIMHPDLAARFPEFRTFTLRGVDSPATIGRLDLTHNGVHALLLGPDGSVAISAVPRDPARVVARPWADVAGPFDCEVHDPHGHAHDHPARVLPEGGYQDRGPLPLRTYRFAMACTGEFAVFHSERQGNPPNVPDALAAVVTITNRTNAVFERDMRVRFLLVANNDQLIFLDPATDPYDGTSSGPNLGANISTLNTRIGFSNYDVGHLVTRIPGGVAYLRAACTSNKGGGVSGVPRTFEADPLGGEVVMHEIGHQFGAGHTFNGNIGFCTGGNYMSASAWEPGSGTTILSYAGSCPIGNDPPGDNIQIVRDLQFHLGNILEMTAFINAGSGGSCATPLETGNVPPVFADLPPLEGLAVPRLTPFELAGVATDANGDALTYSWEQFDLGPQRAMDASDNGTSPIFRVYPPVEGGTRHFPALPGVLSGAIARGERLPDASGTRKFRLIVRDNAPGAGATAISPVIPVQITGAGPFAVLAPGAGEIVRPGPYALAWSVASTNLPPVNASTVTARLSLDGGATYPIVLASNLPNTGGATIEMPALRVPGARVRLEGDGAIFRAYSGAFNLRHCDPDVNCDGSADQDDVACLAQAVAGDWSCLCGGDIAIDPDFNGDGNVDQDDVAALVQVVGGASCP